MGAPHYPPVEIENNLITFTAMVDVEDTADNDADDNDDDLWINSVWVNDTGGLHVHWTSAHESFWIIVDEPSASPLYNTLYTLHNVFTSARLSPTSICETDTDIEEVDD